MSRIRWVLALCAMTLSFAALAMVLTHRGNDGPSDEESAAADAAELEDYFVQMSAIDKRSDKEFEKTVFVEQESARSYGEAFDAVLAMMEMEYGKVTPPESLAAEHETLIKAIKDYRTGVDHGLRPLDSDAPASDFEALFEDILADEDLRVTSAFCAIQDVATAEGIKADVGCQTNV